MPEPRRRRRGRALLGLLLLFACTACDVRLRTEVVLDRDGAGRLAVTLRADAEALRLAAAAGADPLSDLVAAGEELRPDGWRTTATTSEAGARVVRLETDFADPAALATLTEGLSATLGGAEEGQLLSPFSVTVLSDTVELTGAAALRPSDAALADVGLDRATANDLLRDGFASQVVVRMPGEVQRAAGGEVAGPTVAYLVGAGEEVAIDVTARRPPRFAPWELALGVAGGVGLALFVATQLRRRGSLWKRRESARVPAVDQDEL